MRRYLLLLSFLLPLPIFCIAQADTATRVAAPLQKEIAPRVDTTIGLSVTGGSRDYKSLAHALCDGLKGDKAKANAIYNWITHNIRYDVKAMQSGKLKPEKVEKVLKNKLGVCDGYSKLFTALCREAGLRAVTIDGYAKDWIFDNGDQLIIPRHAWNAVLISGQWELVDATWGAGGLVQSPTVIRKIINKVTFRKIIYAKKLKFVFKYKPEYFMQDVEEFRLKHVPADPNWQLTDTAMPLAVFEQGDSAVIAFNTTYSKPAQHTDELMRISSLDPDSVSLDASERAYKFNNRFAMALALKQAGRVDGDLRKVMEEENSDKGKLLWKDAEVALKAVDVHIKEQRKYFPEQYNGLKKKNRAKNTEAKQYMMAIKTDDKKLVAQCDKYKHKSDTKIKKVKAKYAETNNRKGQANPGKINDIEPAKTQKPASDPSLAVIKDSIEARNTRIAALQYDIDERGIAINALKDTNAVRLVALAGCLGVSDSFLVSEAKARIQMHDNYDDEVIKWASLFKEEKYKKADTLHKYYVTCYDTIITRGEAMHKARVAQLDAYKANLRDAEKYAKWNSNDVAMNAKYAEMANAYRAAIDSSTKNLMVTAAYIKGHKKLFYGLAKLYKRQLYIVKYMGNVEDVRKKLEYNTILSKQALDTRENKQQITTVKNAVRMMAKIYK